MAHNCNEDNKSVSFFVHFLFTRWFIDISLLSGVNIYNSSLAFFALSFESLPPLLFFFFPPGFFLSDRPVSPFSLRHESSSFFNARSEHRYLQIRYICTDWKSRFDNISFAACCFFKNSSNSLYRDFIFLFLPGEGRLSLTIIVPVLDVSFVILQQIFTLGFQCRNFDGRLVPKLIRNSQLHFHSLVPKGKEKKKKNDNLSCCMNPYICETINHIYIQEDYEFVRMPLLIWCHFLWENKI